MVRFFNVVCIALLGVTLCAISPVTASADERCVEVVQQYNYGRKLNVTWRVPESLGYKQLNLRDRKRLSYTELALFTKGNRIMALVSIDNDGMIVSGLDSEPGDLLFGMVQGYPTGFHYIRSIVEEYSEEVPNELEALINLSERNSLPVVYAVERLETRTSRVYLFIGEFGVAKEDRAQRLKEVSKDYGEVRNRTTVDPYERRQ